MSRDSPPPSTGFQREGSMDTFPEETSPGSQEEEMIQRGRHGVDPELRDYINGDLTQATQGKPELQVSGVPTS